MYVTAILLAAGRGLRFEGKVHKPLAKINSRPAIIYCLKQLSNNPCIKDIIVVVNPENIKGIIKEINRYGIKKVRAVVFGGRLRQDSVRKGLCVIDAKTDLVLIHDAARPFIDTNMITKVVREARKSGAAIVGVPVKDTIKKVKSQNSKVKSTRQKLKGKTVNETLNRDEFWQIQTPQVFRKDLILEAYQRFGGTKVTDDASLVEKLGAGVTVVMGSYTNIKITTPEDLVIAEAIIKVKSKK
jgi:2-C-methyl-D-erythritol 4-phosphate cytidylyltransferase